MKSISHILIMGIFSMFLVVAPTATNEQKNEYDPHGTAAVGRDHHLHLYGDDHVYVGTTIIEA
jgi:hypothetical protein